MKQPGVLRSLRWVALAIVCVGLPPACAAPSTTTLGGTAINDGLVPPGFGTLRQDEVTLQLRSESLLVQVTPLDEPILRLTAPDTYTRLSRIRDARLEDLEVQSGGAQLQLFLVSFFSYQPNIAFQPEDLQLASLGLRYRPRAISPITAEWGAQRLEQQDTQSAVYGFEATVSLDSDLVVEYAGVSAVGWERILTRLELERSRVRARAGTGR